MPYKVSTRQITETVAPAIEPVSLAEMKAHLRVDGSDSDTLINAQITAVRQWVEMHLQRSLVRRTYRADLWAFFSAIELPRLPLSSVTSIQYYNTDSPQVLTTLSASLYLANLGRSMIYIDPADTTSLPSVASRHDAVQITYVAGYEPSSDSPQDLTGNVPSAIKSAIKLQAADLFENRETNTQLKVTQLPTVDRLLAVYRQY